MPIGKQENIIAPPPSVSSPHRGPAITKAGSLPVPPSSRELPPADIIEAPYRNTRSKSRPVEPPVPHSQLPARKSRAKRKQEIRSTVLVVKDEIAEAGDEVIQEHKRMKKETIRLEPLEEMINENDAFAHTREGISLGESLRDANDVVDSLTRDSIAEESTLVHDDGGQNPELDAQSAPHGGTFDLDDKQTNYYLRQPPAPSSSQHPTSIFFPLMDAEQALQRFNASLSQSTRRSSLQSSVSRTQTRPLAVASRVTRAPVRTISPTRHGSESSAESYPLIGTRAHVVKENIQRDEKKSPYRPPTGTRAAQYSKSSGK